MRPPRLTILGFAGLVALHVFMLAGHGRSHDLPMGVQVMTAHASSSPSLATPMPGTTGGLGMNMTVACLAVLAGLLLLLQARKGQPATVGADRPTAIRPPARPERAGPPNTVAGGAVHLADVSRPLSRESPNPLMQEQRNDPMRRVLLALAAAVLLTACNQGGQQQGTGTAAAVPNDADVTFTQSMIPHHQQAIDMAELVDSHTKRPELRSLTDSIAASQGQEITLMQGWLQTWGKPATPAGMDHGAMQMPGMMSEADMRQLRRSNHEDFDLMFLDMMTAHHQGAIDMATTELRDGSLPEVKRLAQQIIEAQQGEIDQFTQWHQEWQSSPVR